MSTLLEPTTQPGALGIVRELFSRLNLEGIRYCHWKSNEHLGAAVAGLTDLDVLIDAEASRTLARDLPDLGFKRVLAVADRAYKGIEDFLALDPLTGRLAHLHLHHQLVLGERNLKGYHLPWEATLLSTRRMDEEHSLYVTDPHLEMLLLIVRAGLKLRTRDFIRALLRKPYFHGGMLREFRWLKQRIEGAQLVDTARPLVGEQAALELATLVAGTPSVSQLKAFVESTKPGLGTYRTRGAAAAHLERWRREWQTRWNSARQHTFGVPVPSKRTIPRGVVVAFLGCDGAGKSTVTKEIRAWLSWKLDVLPLYFGSGDGPASLPRRLFRLSRWVRGVRPRESGKSAAGDEPGGSAERVSRKRFRPLRELRNTVWALILAYEKRRRLGQALRARTQGMIVICDRYPQTQFVGFNDGPRLSAWLQHRSPLVRALAGWEHRAYQAATVQVPDLVVKLHVTPEVAAQRKPDMPREALPRRAQAIKSLAFLPAARVVDIDSGQPLVQVIHQVKRAIWEFI